MIGYENANGDTLYAQRVDNRYTLHITKAGQSTAVMEQVTDETLGNFVVFNDYKLMDMGGAV